MTKSHVFSLIPTKNFLWYCAISLKGVDPLIQFPVLLIVVQTEGITEVMPIHVTISTKIGMSFSHTLLLLGYIREIVYHVYSKYLLNKKLSWGP